MEEVEGSFLRGGAVLCVSGVFDFRARSSPSSVECIQCEKTKLRVVVFAVFGEAELNI